MRSDKRSGKTNVVVVVVIVVIALWFCGGLAVGLILPAVQVARDAARRAESMNNMKRIGLALHNYHISYDSFPPAFIADEDGQPQTSWRALILPWMVDGYGDEYDYDTAWDDAGNQVAASVFSDAYASPFVREEGYTPYVAVVGPSTVISTDERVRIQDVVDGTAITLCIIEDVNNPVPWTAPIDISPEELLARYEQQDFPRGYILTLMTDGSVRVLDLESPQQFKAMVFRNDGLTPY